VRLPVGDITAYSDRVAGVSVLGNEDAMAAFLHSLFAGDSDSFRTVHSVYVHAKEPYVPLRSAMASSRKKSSLNYRNDGEGGSMISPECAGAGS
jgi:hypothetical protein